MKESTKLQKLAQKENWALFLLIGMKTAVKRFIAPVVSDGYHRTLTYEIDDCIREIKDIQHLRKLK